MLHRLVVLTILMCLSAQGSWASDVPGPMTFRGYSIGQKVDTTLFENMRTAHMPRYMNGWTMSNYDALEPPYDGLPIALWVLKSDSSIALTLLNDVVLSIVLNKVSDAERKDLTTMLDERFGTPAIVTTPEETHPFQAWITFWTLHTWETKDVVVQIGNAIMRKREDPIERPKAWNLSYFDAKQEREIIERYKHR